ncbi:hypothetical protein V6B08_19540 [Ferrovibrio sp. MS7]|uniref:hypothetical protein n=1 Tax=Ferrovibrio plantarum TaxID=3119164 RepID=UPI0031365058
MGRANGKKARFLAEHPICCFCAGARQAVEIDHLPSRACFDGNNWPEGFEFPACSVCNRNTSQEEQIVAFFSRSLANPAFPPRNEEIVKLGLGSRNNLPAAMSEFESTIRPVSDELMAFEQGPEIGNAFEVVFHKWARAFYYLETRRILPVESQILTRTITLDTIQKGLVSEEWFEGETRPLLRNGKDLSGTFGYIYRAEPENELYMFNVMFRRSFAALLFVDVTGRHLREIARRAASS